MNGCTEKLARVLDEPIRPGVVIRLADKANKITTPACAILMYVGLNNTGFLQSNSNGNDGTVNADFCGYGYKVDDPMYRCGSGTLGGNGGVADRFFTTADMTPNVEYSRGLMFINVGTSNYDSLSLEIAPLYSGTLTMEIEDYDGVTIDTQSISDTTKIERVTFDVTSLHGDSRPCYMNFTLSRGGRFAFTGTYADDSFEDLLFNNSNIVKAETFVNSDLYSQAAPNDQIEVTILDINHEYDPANPQGKFAKLTSDREFFLRLGYRLPDRNGAVEWVSGNWNSQSGYRISDEPTYQDQKVTLSLMNDGISDKSNVSIPIQTGLYGVGNEVASRNISIFPASYPNINTTAMIDKQAYMSAAMWITNAQGKYYKGNRVYPNVSGINSLTIRNYEINGNRILDGGVQLDKQPMLKNLVIKQYKNVQSALRLTQSFSVAADDYEYYSAWGKYRARIYNSQELDISCIEMTHTGGVDWRIIYEDVNDSGVLSTSIYVTASSKVVVSGSFNIYGTDSSSTDIVIRVNDEGEDMTIDNPLITSNAIVVSCAEATKIIAAMREVYKVNMVNDIRLENGDCVYLDTLYEKHIPVIITGIKRVMPGIKSEITCRRLNV